MRVIDGGWTRSTAASSPTVLSPSRLSAPSTESWPTGSSSLSGSRSVRIRRESRMTESRSADASPLSVRATFSTDGMIVSITHYPC